MACSYQKIPETKTGNPTPGAASSNEPPADPDWKLFESRMAQLRVSLGHLQKCLVNGRELHAGYVVAGRNDAMMADKAAAIEKMLGTLEEFVKEVSLTQAEHKRRRAGDPELKSVIQKIADVCQQADAHTSGYRDMQKRYLAMLPS